MAIRRIALVAPSLSHIVGNYIALIAALRQDGHRVMCITGRVKSDHRNSARGSQLFDLGVDQCEVDFSPPGLPFLRGIRVTSALRSIFSGWQPDVVVSVGCDASEVCRQSVGRDRRVRFVTLCDALPGFMNPAIGEQMGPSKRGLQRALRRSESIMFCNRDHATMMREAGVVDERAQIEIVPGCGVDIDSLDAIALPDFSHGPVFLMAARLDAIHGVFNYIQAAKRVSAQFAQARFILLGLPGKRNQALDQMAFTGPNFQRLDDGENLRTAMSRAHVFVYPSHSDGMPAPVLQALAAGRPVITTDTPGCRDTVDETVNGILVPRGDVAALGSAMGLLIRRTELIPSMARASRAKAERLFGQTNAIKTMVSALGL